MSVLDTFTFVMKPDDKGVVTKLDEIEKKGKGAEKATLGISEGFKKLGGELTGALNQVLPGTDKLVANLQKIGGAAKAAFQNSASGGTLSRLSLRGAPPSGGSPIPRPGVAGGMGGGGMGGASAAATASGTAGAMALGVAATGAAVALAVLAVGASTLVKSFLDGVKSLSDSRKAAVEAGVNNTQMAAVEQFAKSMRLDRKDAQDALKEIAKTTQEGWVKARERGNIFGIGNEQTQMLKKYGISTTDGNGQLRNSSKIFEDIGKKMQTMSRDSAIAFGQFFGMTRDFATGVYDSKQSLSQFAEANKESIAAQAEAMAESKRYEQAQQALANAWNDFAVKVGGKVIPVVTDLLNAFVDAVPTVTKFGEAVYGTVMMIKDTAETVFDWLKSKADSITDFLFGQGSGQAVRDAIAGGIGDATQSLADSFMRGVDKVAEYGKRGDAPLDANKFARDMNQNTSLNSSAAKIQLEAANLMKTATAKFGLSTEQFMAMWAATSGKASGLRDSGGLTTAGFRDAYKEVTSQYASPEAAVALYGRGQPMMQQLPQQYAMGMGVNQYGLPSNPRGLGSAKSAVEATSAPVGPAAAPFGGSGTKGRKDGGGTNVTIGDVHATINTKSTDPEEINSAVANNLVSEVKFAMNKLGSMEVA
jgi:hypothetical protein